MQVLKCSLLFSILSLCPGLLHAQEFPVVSVDVYGNRQVPEALIRDAIDVTLGEPLSKPRQKIEEAVRALDGVIDCAVYPIMIPGKTTLFVGIKEDGHQALEFHPTPEEDIKLPKKFIDDYNLSMQLLERAIRSGSGSEDRSEGHAISGYAPSREVQLRFVEYANESFLELAEVLQDSRHDEHRIAAAQIIAYTDEKEEAIPELERAARDPNPTVRNNAVRALSVLSEYALSNPDRELVVDPSPFIELLNSFSWTDRNKGSAVIASLSASGDPDLLKTLREKSLPSIREMARWQSLGHAGFALQTLAYLRGHTKPEVDGLWSTWAEDYEKRLSWVEETLAAIKNGNDQKPSSIDR